MNSTLVAACTAFVAFGTAVSAQSLVSINSEIGNVLASAKSGMTLYTFRKDGRNKSDCYSECAQTWPPIVASASAKARGAQGIIERENGTRQWTLNGQRLDFRVGDPAKDDITGRGVGSVRDTARG